MKAGKSEIDALLGTFHSKNTIKIYFSGDNKVMCIQEKSHRNQRNALKI